MISLSELPKDQQRVCSRYVMRLTNLNDVRRIDFSKETLDLLASEYALVNLYRAVRVAIKNPFGITPDVCEKYKVSERDVALVLSHLSPKEQYDWRIKRFAPIKPRESERIVELTMPLIRKLVSQKIGFITRADPSVDATDLVCDLTAEVVKLIRRYDHFSAQLKYDEWTFKNKVPPQVKLSKQPIYQILEIEADGLPLRGWKLENDRLVLPVGLAIGTLCVTYLHHLKIRNYIAQGVDNRASRLIEFYTAACRARQTRTMIGQNGVKDTFRHTTVSLDASAGGDDFDRENHESLTVGEDKDSSRAEEEIFLRQVKNNVSPAMRRYIEIVEGKYDEEFLAEYKRRKGGRNPRDLAHRRDFHDFARTVCGVGEGDLLELKTLLLKETDASLIFG